MKSSETLIGAIKGFEGCKLYAYRDSKGVKTIGFGHTKNVRMGQAITMNQAIEFLKEDLKESEDYVNSLKICKTQGQFDALVDFVYNCGRANLESSTLLKYIKAGRADVEIQSQFSRWNKCKVNGKYVELPGLTRRRLWEAKRWSEI